MVIRYDIHMYETVAFCIYFKSILYEWNSKMDINIIDPIDSI